MHDTELDTFSTGYAKLPLICSDLLVVTNSQTENYSFMNQCTKNFYPLQ